MGKSKIAILLMATVFASLAFASISLAATPKYTLNQTKYPPSTPYLVGKNYGFQINWTDPTLINITFETNFTGSVANYTFDTTPAIVNTTGSAGNNTYYINFTQHQFKGAYGYYYIWYANNTGGEGNSTGKENYTVTQAKTELTIIDIPSESNSGDTIVAQINYSSGVYEVGHCSCIYGGTWTDFAAHSSGVMEAGFTNPITTTGTEAFYINCSDAPPGYENYTANTTSQDITTYGSGGGGSSPIGPTTIPPTTPPTIPSTEDGAIRIPIVSDIIDAITGFFEWLANLL